jgi:hypothetical protein
VQKLFEKCSPGPRFAMLERLTPHLAMIGIHKNGTWAAQKIIECVQTPEEIALIAQNLRPYGPPLLLDQFGNYVVQYVQAFKLCHFAITKAYNVDAACALVLPPMTSSSTPWSIVSGRLLRAALVLAA